MVLPWVILFMRIFDMADCQVNFPTDQPDINDCIASNGENGVCHEFRSTGFDECAFFPSDDTSNSNNAKHLENNVCRNTGKAIYFCCPFNSTPKIPEVKDPQKPEVNVARPSFLPNEDECGMSLSNNVVGGELTSPSEWPWLAALGRNADEKLPGGGFKPFCGGTLVTKQHVISAAHCFRRINATDVFVRLGEYDTNTINDGALDFQIVDVRHEQAYDHKTKQNDISILKLEKPLNEFTDRIRPACLPHPQRNDHFEGITLIVVGWGVFDNRRQDIISPVPLKGSVPVVPIPECQKKYARPGSTTVISDNQICAGTGVTDSCKGDSGGPINYLDVKRGRFYVVGLTSFGPTPCGNEDVPGVYTRFGYYLNWIEENIKQLL